MARQGRTRETINLLAGLLQSQPYNPQALELLGESLAKAGRRRDAEQALLRAVRFDPERPTALFRLGELAGESGRYREALGYWRRLIELAPDSEIAARARIQARMTLGGAGTSLEGATAGSGT